MITQRDIDRALSGRLPDHPEAHRVINELWRSRADLRITFATQALPAILAIVSDKEIKCTDAAIAHMAFAVADEMCKVGGYK